MSYIHPDDMPDTYEIGILNAEQEAWQNAVIRRNIRNYKPEDWDKANAASIERGDGPLPF